MRKEAWNVDMMITMDKLSLLSNKNCWLDSLNQWYKDCQIVQTPHAMCNSILCNDIWVCVVCSVTNCTNAGHFSCTAHKFGRWFSTTTYCKLPYADGRIHWKKNQVKNAPCNEAHAWFPVHLPTMNASHGSFTCTAESLHDFLNASRLVVWKCWNKTGRE